VLVEIHVPDFQRAYDFYKLLGFEMVWMEETYLVLRRGDSVLCCYGGSPDVHEHPYFGRFLAETKKGYGVEIILFVEDVASLYRKLEGLVTIVEPLALKHWGSWDFRIEDPFGFYLRVSQRYDTVNRPDRIAATQTIAAKKGFRV
jgi:catechol 2,3-dioxygenase-like lactoylglutathione lyase family enzyme